MTPDPDSIEVEMLDSDSHGVYHHSVADMSVASSHDTVPAMASGIYLSPQDIISDQSTFMVVLYTFG